MPADPTPAVAASPPTARTGGSRLAGPVCVAVAALSCAGYALVAHRLTIDADRSWLGYGVAIGSAVLLVLAMAWASRWRWPVVVALLGLGLAGWHARDALRVVDPRWFYLLQHAGMQALLGVFFGRTLRAGREPLITTLALRVHHRLPPDLLAYTRQVTVAWTGFFAAMTLLSLGLWCFAPASWWSVMANFLTMPAVVAMFIAEYRIRLRRFPDFEHATLLDGVRVFQRRSE
ncbi:MAG: hypothetical protein QM766_03395 [Burkholderiaceae bacterium]